MASEPQRTRLALGRSGRRLSFERRIRIWLFLLGLPLAILTWLFLHHLRVDPTVLWITELSVAILWAFVVGLFVEQIVRPLQTLSNVVAALREDDYSFRARGGRRNDALGDLALEINALAGMLQGQRSSALEAMALVEHVMSSMQSPVFAFDPEGRLKLLNDAAEKAFTLRRKDVLHQHADSVGIGFLLNAADDEVLPLAAQHQAVRWAVKRAGFRLRGVPHALLVLSDVSAVLREEERIAWERLIRVLGHEINNSLAPIKSIAGTLRGRLPSLALEERERDDFERGLDVVANRAESLNRFLQAYRELMGLPAPRLLQLPLAALVDRVTALETRLAVTVRAGPELTLTADPDQVQQALINLVRNAAEAALSLDATSRQAPQVEIGWRCDGTDVVIRITDNGPGILNEANLFVPFYTTKRAGTGIGLVLAKQIAEAHGGTVRLKNRMDTSGCEVEFRIPSMSGGA